MIHLAAQAFSAEVPGGRLGGLDVGTRTIGLATCDSSWSFATPADTVRRTKFAQDLEALRHFVGRHALTGLVVGLPLSLDGSDSSRTQSVRAFARNLSPLRLPIWRFILSAVCQQRMITSPMRPIA